MKKTAIILGNGVEEGEVLTIADIIRRANFTCDLVGLEKTITGGHHITIMCDQVLNESIKDYDMIILPGGYGGVDEMCKSPLLLSILQDMYKAGKYVTAICAAPIVLEKAGVLEGKKWTAYRGYEEKISMGTFVDEKVVIDGNLITSRGPATCYAFAYKLVDVLGGDSLAVKKRMVYFNAFDVKEDE